MTKPYKKRQHRAKSWCPCCGISTPDAKRISEKRERQVAKKETEEITEAVVNYKKRQKPHTTYTGHYIPDSANKPFLSPEAQAHIKEILGD